MVLSVHTESSHRTLGTQWNGVIQIAWRCWCGEIKLLGDIGMGDTEMGRLSYGETLGRGDNKQRVDLCTGRSVPVPVNSIYK